MTDVRKLRLQDILDQRAYERERPAFQEEVLRVKRLRRVALGPILTLVFENVLTVRWQIQEMARVERLLTDEQILEELKVYNPLIPDPGELSATLFLELTNDEALRQWLPKLVGIEQALLLGLAAPEQGGARSWVRCKPEETHAEQLTRDAVTASVHYIRFELTAEQVDMFSAGPVLLASDHPEYKVEIEIPEQTRNELISDLHA